MAIAVLTTSSVIAALIAAVLYTTSYLSLVYLLKYPRNWLPPSVSASLATGGMAVVTIVYVSVSPIGMDVSKLFVSAAFITVLFAIIAAPAVDFLPRNRPVVAFLANHGAYAGLWMLPPAIAVGYAFSDARLLGVLAAAMIIELAWFLRCRRSGERHLYPLSDHDMSIMEAQAKGDITGFAKQYGIRELELSGDGAGWHGCGKNTLPCSFNLYTNRLGLNTPPCCREHMKDLCHYVATCLREMGVVHWLEGGSLLGSVREKGKLLAWEDDVDISVVLDDRMSWASIAKGLAERGLRDGYYVDAFAKEGLISISYDPPLRWPFQWQRNRMRGEIRLDLVVYRHAFSHGQPVLERRGPKAAMPLTESGWHGVPKEIILPTSTIRFLGDDIACPNQPEAYLRILYDDYAKVELTYVDATAAETRRLGA